MPQEAKEPASDVIGASKATAKHGLEDLPAELKLTLLSSLSNLADLQSLVHASPLYHSVYLTDRCALLHCVLSNELDPTSFQYLLAIARALDIRQECSETKEEVLKFLEAFKNVDIQPVSDSKQLFLRHGPSLAKIQGSIQFAVQDYCTAVLSKHPVSGEPIKPEVSLSPTEQARISRAFYRHQVYCIVFRSPSESQFRFFDNDDKSWLFLHLFPTWEVDEIACVWDYTTQKYAMLYKKYATELSVHSAHYDDDKVDEYDSTYSYMDRIVEPDDVMIDDYVESCNSRGLVYLRSMLQAAASPPRQIEMLRENAWEFGDSLRDVLMAPPYDHTFPTQGYIDWTNRVELRFTNDTVKDVNAAWVWSTGGRVEIMYARWYELIEWGYVFWDKERLDGWGVLDTDNSKYIRTS